ncbi:MAG: hypothetical protein U5N27_05165 [Rhizobium sp.]|nr:hypothetical protein [Rhizobium sp.]
MSLSTIDHDDSLKLGHGDAQSAKAPARKFALAEIQDRTLWSPGIFAVLSMGLGAYLGRLREIVNPSPNTHMPEDRKAVALDDGTAPPVEDDAREQRSTLLPSGRRSSGATRTLSSRSSHRAGSIPRSVSMPRTSCSTAVMPIGRSRVSRSMSRPTASVS